MIYELDDLDRDLLTKCRSAVQSANFRLLDEDDTRESVELLVKLTAVVEPRKWPYRCTYLSDLGYVVWRDVFDGQMRCPIDAAVRAHKVAVFVTESESEDYLRYRNESGF